MAGPEAYLQLWTDLPEFRSLLDGVKKGYGEQAFFGLQPGQVAFLAAALRRWTGRPVLLVAAGFREALELATDVSAWLGDDRADYFPPMEVVPYHVVARSPDVAGQRLAVLQRLAAGQGAGVVVAPAGALLRALVPAGVFRQAVLAARPGQELDLSAAMGRLVDGGYERVDRVESPGQFSVRGGLLDVYPLTGQGALRLQWFGDVVESVRSFDVASQRSLQPMEAAVVPPAREAVLPAGGPAAWRERLRDEAEEAAARLERAGRVAQAQALRERVGSHLARMEPGLWELYAPFLYPPATLLDYFPSRPLVVLADAPRVFEAVEGASRQWSERVVSLLDEGRLLPSQERLQFGPEEWRRRLAAEQVLFFSLLPRSLPGTEPRQVLSVASKSVPAFRGQWDLFLDELRAWLEQRYACCVFAASEERARRLAAGLREAAIPVRSAEAWSRAAAPEAAEPVQWREAWPAPAPGQVAIVPGSLHAGFVFPALRLVCLAEQEALGKRRQPRRRDAARAQEGVRLATYQDLKIGDYVVHVQHGIGQYLGISTEEILGVKRDYLVIRYEGTDRLKVPVDQIQLVQKYVGGEGRAPRVNKLGGNEWARVKQRVKESVHRMAEELLRLYAAREALEGYAFTPDTVWQREFEEAFPYQETPDQLQAVTEIKRDMERPRPMDRLLCGDVGFGKTEVAMRAAFKAVMDGKQVAVLVPTTILAQQHYLTFTARFEGFPVRIRVLSRFQTQKEQAGAITALRKGEVDIIIGTHRLLQPDVNFKDLGLLIIDEEHRFGVAHKEALKRLRATVDVLTLTATPIPRTLHMSMAGLRDMSVIETPPENRFPVETYVIEYDEGLVRDAIERELARGGQVYYVHNRVRGIDGVRRRVGQLAPGARISVAHGQMPEDDLEQVMLDFLEGRSDILVCTSIIESGLDIANANTLVVEDSDRFGLAQLYQIRGRVGRSNRMAYAYFTYRREKILNEVAQKRLEAIKEFTELGSGFKIALRDLEIRGAGNILGPEQHGFIVSVGFDLYCQMLAEAVRELKGERAVPRTEPVIELAVDAYLDDAYIPDARSKIEIYKKVHAITTLQEAGDLEAELADRFGPLPEPAANLLGLARLKARAANLGVLAISQERAGLRVTFPGYLRELVRSMENLRTRFGRRLAVQLAPKPALRLRAEAPGEPALELAAGLLSAIENLSEVQRWLDSRVSEGAIAGGQG